MNYKKINTLGAWVVFAIATFVYLTTIEDTVSLWDCGEYITAAYKLEVGHPPGAPLFMMLGRLFSFFVAPEHVAQMINSMSALCSSFTILFMYWSISMLAKKIALKDSNRTLSDGQIIAIQGSALVGSLAYTFTDSFWFSAVEGEVYAMAAVFTAIIFWAILRWDEESTEIKFGELVHHKSTHRWIILIMFLFGLAIGVHLLGLLVVPAIAYVIYFNKWENFNWKGFFIAGFVGILALGFIQSGVITGTIRLASSMEYFFVNNLGLPFNSGALGFFLLIIAVLTIGLVYTQRKKLVVVNTAILSFIVLLIGYSAFALIVIRSNANPPLDENDPENLVSLHSYLLREQYGTWPLLTGPYWNAKTIGAEDRSPSYARMFVVTKNGEDQIGFKDKALATKYQSKNGGEVVEKYYTTNDGKSQVPVYEPEHTTFLPRMFWNSDQQKIDGYKKWSGYDAHGQQYAEKPTIPTADGLRLPTFGENMRYMFTYQFGWMYFRYFMWNFVGRQNDIQGHGDVMRGNWQSGIDFVDQERIGSQSIAPDYTTKNPSHNSFYFLPLILGIIGLVFHLYKAPKDAFVVFLLFIFTGIAIIFYLNAKPFEPRERDYAYAGSFYAFAIWIGLSVYALFDVFKSFSKKELKPIMLGVGGILALMFVADSSSGEFSGSYSWLVISAVALAMGGVMYLLKGKANEKTAAFTAIVLTIFTPILMGMQGWDDHDRGNRTTALDLAKNYLDECEKNSILFTNGDNDTFPLWYLQEVEEKNTSVRVCNLSLLQTDWYTEQMTMKAYDSDPLPISMTPDQMVGVKGKTDVIYFSTSYYQLATDYSKELADTIFAEKIKYNQAQFNNAYRNAAFTLAQIISQTSIAAQNPQIIQTLTTPIMEPGIKEFGQFFQLSLQLLQNGSKIGLTQEIGERLQQNISNLEAVIDFLPIKESVGFALNDKRLVTKTRQDGSSDQIRVFPSSGFIIPIKDKQELIKNKVVDAKYLSQLPNEIRFKITEQAIYKDQVVMMDVLAHFDWKRNIYFSSPFASEVGKALLNAGFVTLEGTVYKLCPIRGLQIDKDKLYDNLMNKYKYGNMGAKGVLVDYYTRRHTTQYRHYFYVLAAQFAQDYTQAKAMANTPDSLIPPSERGKDTAKSKEKTIAIVNKAMQVMPLENVLDYGEPNSQKQQAPGNPQDYTYAYSDGKVHELVALLYRVDANQEAEALGSQVADRLESIMNFVLNSPISVSYNLSVDFFSALDAYSTMFAATPDKSSPLSKRMESYIGGLQARFNKMLAQMKEADADKVRDEKLYSTYVLDYQDRMLKMPLFAAANQK